MKAIIIINCKECPYLLKEENFQIKCKLTDEKLNNSVLYFAEKYGENCKLRNIELGGIGEIKVKNNE